MLPQSEDECCPSYYNVQTCIGCSHLFKINIINIKDLTQLYQHFFSLKTWNHNSFYNSPLTNGEPMNIQGDVAAFGHLLVAPGMLVCHHIAFLQCGEPSLMLLSSSSPSWAHVRVLFQHTRLPRSARGAEQLCSIGTRLCRALGTPPCCLARRLFRTHRAWSAGPPSLLYILAIAHLLFWLLRFKLQLV